MRAMLRIGAALLSIAAAVGCNHVEADAPAAESPSVAEPALEVETELVRRGAILPRISVPGSLVARRESHIGSRVYGRIERIWVHEGDRVEQGDPLFQVERTTYEARLLQAEAGLDLARAEREQLEADLARALKLHEQEFLSEQEVDRLTTQLAVARARERQSQHAVTMARQELDGTITHAPFAGSISARLADEGTTAANQPPTIVVILQETGILEVRCAIAETTMALIREGDPAWLHIEGFNDPIETRVASVGDTVDPETRTYLVRMTVPNPNHLYKAGVFVHAEIEPRSKSDVVLVPREAIRTEDGRSLVFVVREERAVPVPIVTGIFSEDVVEVVRGVEPGMEIITGDAVDLVAPGSRVQTTPRKGSPA